jgi:hypothetical protein
MPFLSSISLRSCTRRRRPSRCETFQRVGGSSISMQRRAYGARARGSRRPALVSCPRNFHLGARTYLLLFLRTATMLTGASESGYQQAPSVGRSFPSTLTARGGREICAPRLFRSAATAPSKCRVRRQTGRWPSWSGRPDEDAFQLLSRPNTTGWAGCVRLVQISHSRRHALRDPTHGDVWARFEAGASGTCRRASRSRANDESCRPAPVVGRRAIRPRNPALIMTNDKSLRRSAPRPHSAVAQPRPIRLGHAPARLHFKLVIILSLLTTRHRNDSRGRW